MNDFSDLSFGTSLEYVGPDTFDGEWVAPADLHGPYVFRHTSMHGTLTLETCFKGRRRLSPDHPANNAAYWRVAQ